jgi:hypothetical protein
MSKTEMQKKIIIIGTIFRTTENVYKFNQQTCEFNQALCAKHFYNEPRLMKLVS